MNNSEEIIKRLSDKNLNLKDEGLYGIDPYAEDLSEEMQKRTQEEAMINPAYFFALAKIDKPRPYPEETPAAWWATPWW